MSDSPASKKGMRTFASDFARVKDATPTPKPVPEKSTPVPPPPTPTKTGTTIPTPPSKTIPTPAPKSNVPHKIPAFHEIEKTLSDIDLSGTEKKKKAGHSSQAKKGITPSKRVGGGAIITDTKTNSFSLFSEAKKSLTNWFTKRKKKPAPKLAVPTAERRKGVIQQATTKSGTIFTADNETLRARIKARKLQESQKTHKPETNWSPYTESGYTLLESGEEESSVPMTNNVVVEFKKRSVPIDAQTTSKPKSDSKPEITPTQPTPSQPIVTSPKPEIQTPATATPAQPEVAEKTEEQPKSESGWQSAAAVSTTPVDTPPPAEPEPETMPQPVEPEPEPEPEPEEIVPAVALENPEESFAVPTDQTPIDTDFTAKRALTTNQLTMYISGGLALVLVSGFFAWVVFNNQTENNSTVEPSIAIMTGSATPETIIVDQTFTTTSLRSFTGTALYTEVALSNSDQELLPAALVFSLVTPDLPAGIQQFATEVRFIQFDSNVPQLMISVVDPASVTGAMLAHESDLATALQPLYGEIESGTYTDQTIANSDARVLTTGDRQSLTYGIINNDTLVVTVSPDAFAEISSLITN